MEALSHKPVVTRRVRFCAAAAGPISRVNTKSIPTTCVHKAIARPDNPKKSTDISLRDTPRASANSGCKLANNSGRAMNPSKRRDSALKAASVGRYS